MAVALLCSLWTGAARADVVKPALIEISVYTSGKVHVDLRASIEALLTGINARYRNTQDAPNAAEYDALRVLPPDALREKFVPFEKTLLERIDMLADGLEVELAIEKVTIPEPGYTKVPRISVIELTGTLDRSTKELGWYYPAAFGDNAVRVRQVDEENEQWHWSEWQWIRDDSVSKPFPLDELFTRLPVHEVVLNYISIGFDHILPRGTDHILFIVGIFLLSVQLRPLLWQVTMFTIAHTITLGLAMTGYLDIPERIVQPLIALSIAWIGIENVFLPHLSKHRLAIVFAFGLLHGIGFAEALAEFGMPDGAFMTALISFNIGVELGQVAIIGLCLLTFGLWFRNRGWYRTLFVIPASLFIAAVGLFWMYDRLEWI
ncbi:MAG: HupE/UreJ family protein [Gammaproteobacteria bacterium]